MGALVILLVMGGVLGMGMGAGGGDEASAEGSDQSERISGSDGDDMISGGGGNDLLLGKAGNDTLMGDAGSDWLLGSDGADHLMGNAGHDVLIGGNGPDQIIGGAGNDFVESANVVDESQLESSAASAVSLSDVIVAYDLPSSSDEGDNIDLGDGDDTVVAGDNDIITGGSGADEFALGDWVRGGSPVEITDFDMAEDIISIALSDGAPSPDIEVEDDPVTGVKTIYADGQAIAVLPGAAPEFSLRNIAITSYAA